MALMHKKTYELFYEVCPRSLDLFADEGKAYLESQFVQIDDIIAPLIQYLNRRGYKTQFCCSGHPYPGAMLHITGTKADLNRIISCYNKKLFTEDDIETLLLHKTGLTDECYTYEDPAITIAGGYASPYIMFSDDIDLTSEIMNQLIEGTDFEMELDDKNPTINQRFRYNVIRIFHPQDKNTDFGRTPISYMTYLLNQFNMVCTNLDNMPTYDELPKPKIQSDESGSWNGDL